MTCARATRLIKREAPTKADKMRRACWQCAWLFLYRPSPTPFFAWRRFLLRSFGATIGQGAHPYPAAWIFAPWNLTMEEESCLADGAKCYNAANVILGARAIVSQGAYLCSASHDYNSSAFDLMVGEIRLEKDSWVAAEAFVGPGVTLHEGSVALARAVVVRDVPAWTVLAGNPARQVAMRKPHTPQAFT